MARVAFKQCDVQRAIRAAKAEGIATPTVEIAPDGTLRLLTTPVQPKPLDALERWEAERDAKRAAARS